MIVRDFPGAEQFIFQQIQVSIKRIEFIFFHILQVDVWQGETYILNGSVQV